MLHSEIEMRIPKILQRIALMSSILWIFGSGFLLQQEPTDPVIRIDVPLAGEAVQGLVTIVGTIEAENLQSYSLEFAFASQEDPGWFKISNGSDSVIDDLIGEWDTSTIPDDTYKLRLIVKIEDLEPIVTIIEGIRVRNYSIIETNTPAPTSELSPTPTPLLESSPTPTAGMALSPTPYAKNPAEFSSSNLETALVNGGIAGLALFAVLLIFWLIRQKSD